MSKPTTVKEAIKNFETEKGVTAANEEKVRACVIRRRVSLFRAHDKDASGDTLLSAHPRGGAFFFPLAPPPPTFLPTFPPDGGKKKTKNKKTRAP